MKAKKIDLRSISSILTLAAAWALGIGGTTMMPLQVSSMMSRLRISESDATIILGAEMLGMLLGCIFLPKIAIRQPAHLTIISLLALLICQYFSGSVSNHVFLGGLRLLAGCAEAAMIVMVGVSLASSPYAEKLWGIVIFLSGLAAAGMLTLLSLLPAAFYERGIWFGLTALAFILGLFVRRLPSLIRARAPVWQPNRHRTPRKIWLTWGIFLAVYSVQAGVWAVSGIQGERVGLSISTTGILLAVSSLLGFVGAVIPTIGWFAAHRTITLGAALITIALSVALFFKAVSGTQFFLSQLALNCAFYVVMAMLNSFISERDPDGSLLSRSVIVTFAAVAFGTVGAGALFELSGGPGLTMFACFALVAVIPIAIALYRRNGKLQSYSSTSHLG